MKAFTSTLRSVFPLFAAPSFLFFSACASAPPSFQPHITSRLDPRPAAQLIIQSPPFTPRPPFHFSPSDSALLDQVQESAFWWMWDSCDPATGLTRDRSSKTYSSVAAVGFKLAALPVAVERHFISRHQAADRTRAILSALEKSPTKAGLFFHFIDGSSAQLPPDVPESVVSTIDSALLFSGLIVASSYFKDDIAIRADALLARANWKFFSDNNAAKPHWQGFISLGWKPDSNSNPTSAGALLPYYWIDAGDEQRLVTFLALAAPDPNYRIPPQKYFQLRRMIGFDPASGSDDNALFAYIPWSGATFTYFFAHCFINYSALGPDNPSLLDVPHRPRIDWWENSRRAFLMHRRKAIQNPRNLPSLGPDAWGLTASDYASGYQVPGLYPAPVRFTDSRSDFDFESDPAVARDDFGDGTLAPYGSACAILFEPALALRAIRHAKNLKHSDGSPLVWRDFRSAHDRAHNLRQNISGYGFLDSYNLASSYVASDYLGIDQGPMILAIENARTGLVWNLFHSHPLVRQGLERLRLAPVPTQSQ